MGIGDYIRKIIDSKIEDISQGMICKVISFDGVNMKADVQPLLSIKHPQGGDPITFPSLPDLPVGYIKGAGNYIRPEYAAGDLVWVVFSSYDIEDALDEQERPISGRKFTFENAMVIAGILSNKETAPAEFSESGLLIGNESGNGFLKIEDGKFTMKFGSTEILFDAAGVHVTIGSTTIDLKAAGVEQTISGVKNTLKSHMHPTAATGPPSPPLPE